MSCLFLLTGRRPCRHTNIRTSDTVTHRQTQWVLRSEGIWCWRSGIYSTHPLLTIVDCVRLLLLLLLLLLRVAGHDTAVEIIWVQL